MKHLNIVKCITLFIFTFVVQVFGDKTVLTSHGLVRGIEVSVLDKQVNAFLGIPFAEPPVGELRFQNPFPAKPWEGVFEAAEKSQPCMQYITRPVPYAPTGNLTEDCLYLNVWTPSTAQHDTALKPVLVFIHGGLHAVGSANLDIYDGSTLSAYGNIIVASFNYRLGGFGFLTGFIPEADGSMGLFDQIQALKWIKINAKAFGGDPDQITIMGQDVGAISTVSIMINNTLEDLFQRVILQSGAATSPYYWLLNKERLLKRSNDLAIKAGCASEDITMKNNPKQVVECLKQLPAEQLSKAEGKSLRNFPILLFPRTGDSVTPSDCIREGKFKNVEVLLGVTEDDGYFILQAMFPNYFGGSAIPHPTRTYARQIIRRYVEHSKHPLSQEISNFYIKNSNSSKYMETMENFIGDFMVQCGMIFQADFFALYNNPVYFYKFSHKPSTSLYPNWIRATRFEELQFVFGLPLKYPDKYTEEEVQFARRMVDRWVAFIKTGDPNVPGTMTWPNYTHRDPKYLNIDLNDSVRSGRSDDYRCEFWRKMFRLELDEKTSRGSSLS